MFPAGKYLHIFSSYVSMAYKMGIYKLLTNYVFCMIIVQYIMYIGDTW